MIPSPYKFDKLTRCFGSLYDLLDPANMTEEERAAVWTLMTYISKRRTAIVQESSDANS